MKHEMVRERETWEMDYGISPSEKKALKKASLIAATDADINAITNGDATVERVDTPPTEPRSDSADTTVSPTVTNSDTKAPVRDPEP